MSKTANLSIAFDPRDLWFQAGYQFRPTGIAQWAQDMESPARALERFLVDDCDFTPIQSPARAHIAGCDRIEMLLCPRARTGLAATAAAGGRSLDQWLREQFAPWGGELRILDPRS